MPIGLSSCHCEADISCRIVRLVDERIDEHTLLFVPQLQIEYHLTDQIKLKFRPTSFF